MTSWNVVNGSEMSMAGKKTTKQAPKRARPAAKRRPPRKPVSAGKPTRPEDHENYQKDLPAGFLQNTNPRQNQTF